MPTYHITLTHSTTYKVEAEGLDAAREKFDLWQGGEDDWPVVGEETVRTIARPHAPALPAACLKEYRLDYVFDKEIVHSQTVHRREPRAARDTACEVAAVIAGLLSKRKHKPIYMQHIEMRVRQLDPRTMLRRDRVLA